jgi:hypothetical protein
MFVCSGQGAVVLHGAGCRVADLSIKCGGRGQMGLVGQRPKHLGRRANAQLPRGNSPTALQVATLLTASQRLRSVKWMPRTCSRLPVGMKGNYSGRDSNQRPHAVYFYWHLVIYNDSNYTNDCSYITPLFWLEWSSPVRIETDCRLDGRGIRVRLRVGAGDNFLLHIIQTGSESH